VGRLKLQTAGSSNGRTLVSGTRYLGSNPSPANQKRFRKRNRFYFSCHSELDSESLQILLNSCLEYCKWLCATYDFSSHCTITVQCSNYKSWSTIYTNSCSVC